MFPQLWPSFGWAVGHRPIATEVRVRYRSSPCEICGGESATRAGYLLSMICSFHVLLLLLLLLLLFHQCSTLIIHSPTNVSI